MADNPDVALSRALNAIATELEAKLTEITGADRPGFVLLVTVSTEVQYVANVRREDGIDLIKGLFKRWGNPQAIPDLSLHQKEELIGTLVQACENYHQALDMAFAELIIATRSPPGEPFFPSKSPMWPVMSSGLKAIQLAKATLATSKELATSGPMAVPPSNERH
jgi:hypothetical protein